MNAFRRTLRTKFLSTSWYGALFAVLLLQISGLSPLIGLQVSNVVAMVSVDVGAEAEAPLDGSKAASILVGFPEIIHSLHGIVELKRETIAAFLPRKHATLTSVAPPIPLRPPEA